MDDFSLEYGKENSPQIEKIKCNPVSFYGKAKYFGSKLLLKKLKTKIIILRLYQVYGPYQKFDRLVPYVIKSCLKNKKFNCSDGLQLRDFLHVEDLTNLFGRNSNRNEWRFCFGLIFLLSKSKRDNSIRGTKLIFILFPGIQYEEICKMEGPLSPLWVNKKPSAKEVFS